MSNLYPFDNNSSLLSKLGKLIPEQLDNIFEQKRGAIIKEIKSKQDTINELTELVERAKGEERNDLVPPNEESIVPNNLPESVRYILFGPRNDG